MISVQVTYRIKPDFVEKNKKNIHNFLVDFKSMLTTKFLYNVYVKEDGLTFVHHSMYADEAMQQEVLNTPSFLAFQRERDEHGLIEAPSIEILTHIGSSMRTI
ncbi:hypothetical protein [Pedobacter sp. ASV28]|jgi:quinol monooxygenase YgiN|uniref:hypothetical protein n=1 Tax=Pedobacter sp. ASV28 TaxID=2795123 RepID=UPI0018ECA4A5|nr:hypothetical protein [Pedobacter sp. ASV28]